MRDVWTDKYMLPRINFAEHKNTNKYQKAYE